MYCYQFVKRNRCYHCLVKYCHKWICLKQNRIFFNHFWKCLVAQFHSGRKFQISNLSPSLYIQIIVLFPFHLFLIVSFYHCISHLSFPGLHPYLSTYNGPQSQTEHVRTNFSAAVLSTCFSVKATQCSYFTVTNSMISICGMPLVASQVFDWKYTTEIWCNYQPCYSFLPKTDNHVFVSLLINNV